MSRAIERFENLIAWQKARDLTREIYQITQRGTFARNFGLTGQIQRVAVSIRFNIAEGFERGGHREFSRFLAIAKASCAEVRSQLYVALDVGYLTSPALTISWSRQRSWDVFLVASEPQLREE